jgi:uncharacterized membrane protein
MPFDLSLLDLVALAVFLAAWIGYNLVFDHFGAERTSLNAHMKGLRQAWMERMLERENRITDAALFGHTIHSISFFASTTMLILAGIIGMLGGLDRAFGVVAELSVAGRAAFEFKLLVLLVMFVYAFFRFTWALRQFNYCCALLGGAPLPPVEETRRRRLAAYIATVLSLGIGSFNGGLRAYYFAVAVLAWFVHPAAFLGTTLAVLAVLFRRQYYSRTYHAIAGEAELLLGAEKA